MKKSFSYLMLSLVLLLSNCVKAQKIDINSFEKKLNDEVQLLDVRTIEEFEEGHIPYAKNINVNGEDFIPQVETLDKNQPVYIYCRTGNRSKKASDLMKKNGFKQIIIIDGGFTAWQEAGKKAESGK